MEAVANWYDVGIELDIPEAELNLIKKNVVKDSVVPVTKNMLADWSQNTGGLASELITAIHKAGFVTYAETLKG